MDQFRKELMFSLLEEFKEEKRRKSRLHFQGQVRLLGLLVGVLGLVVLFGLFVS
jgi:hypothetical protein